MVKPTITFLICTKCKKNKPINKFRKLLRHGNKNLRAECYNCEKQYFAKSAVRIKKEVLGYYSQGKMKCECCPENEIDFLTIDHIDNDGAEKRRNGEPLGQNLYRWLIKNNFPPGFQVLCWNCNCGKRINKGICPHKKIQK